MPDTLQTAIKAARLAAEAIVAARQVPLDVQSKGYRDLVTNADYAAQDVIVRTLLHNFPDHQIWAEERGLQPLNPAAAPTWIIDPVDGTSNFSHGLPLFATSIGLLEQGELTVGVVYDPLRQDLFHARKGEGAFLNGRRLQVSDRTNLEYAIIACDWPREPALRARNLALLQACLQKAHTCRSLGAATLGLCYVAAGWLEAYFNFALQAWDLAAATVIVREAGGQISAPTGETLNLTQGACLATNGHIHGQMVHLVTGA